jgi:hypothetical protein
MMAFRPVMRGGLRLEWEELVGVEPELGEDSSQLLHDLHPPPEQRRDVSSNSFGAIEENLGASLESGSVHVLFRVGWMDGVGVYHVQVNQFSDLPDLQRKV